MRAWLLSLLCLLACVATRSYHIGRGESHGLKIFPRLRVDALRAFVGTKETKSKNKQNSNIYKIDRKKPSAIVFVGNLPYDIKQSDIEQLIVDNIGPKEVIANIQIMTGAKTKRFLGFLFIHFYDNEIAMKAVEYLNGLQYLDRTLNSNIKDIETIGETTKLKQKNFQLKYGHCIYLSNLDYSLTEQEIANMCDDILGPGLVEFVRIPVDKSSKVSRGYAHIQFKAPESVEKAIQELTGLEVFGRQLNAEKLKSPKEMVKKEVPVSDGDANTENFTPDELEEYMKYAE